MRSLLLPASLLLVSAIGCRAPAIPAEPTAREYAVWHDLLRSEAERTHAPEILVSPETRSLDEAQLQFQRCLPPHMWNIFDDAPAATLSRNVPEDWLRLPNGSLATLAEGAPAAAAGATVQLRLSRVAFSRFHREGYVWVERRSCAATGTGTHCDGREGGLIRVTAKGDHWSVEETECRTLAFGENG